MLVILLILLPVTFITIAVVRELTGAADKSAGRRAAACPATIVPGLGWLLEQLRAYVDIDIVAAQQFIAARLQTVGATLAASTLVVVGGAVGAIVQMALVVFTMFYMFRDGDRIRQSVYQMLPLERVQMQDITVRTRDVIGATIYGVLVISAIQGTLGTFIFWALGLPSPLLWGVVMFFLSMIPMAGAFLVWAPAALYLALTGAYVKAAILVAWGILVIGSIDNFLSPRLVGKRASTPRAADLLRRARRPAGVRRPRSGPRTSGGRHHPGADRDGAPVLPPAVRDVAGRNGDGETGATARRAGIAAPDRLRRRV